MTGSTGWRCRPRISGQMDRHALDDAGGDVERLVRVAQAGQPHLDAIAACRAQPSELAGCGPSIETVQGQAGAVRAELDARAPREGSHRAGLS